MTALLALQELGSAQMGEQTMTMGGWLFMGCAWLFVISLVIICFSRVLGGGPGE